MTCRSLCYKQVNRKQKRKHKLERQTNIKKEEKVKRNRMMSWKERHTRMEQNE